MTRLLRPLDEIEDLGSRSIAGLERILSRIVRAHVGGETEALARANADLGSYLGAVMSLSDMLGRRRLLLEVDAAKGRGKRYAANPSTPLVPRVPFREAVKNMVHRDPRLAFSAAEVARLYSQDMVFAMARSVSQTLTERVQAIMADMLSRGRGTEAVERAILRESEVHQAVAPFTRAYAETVWRTNLVTAYTGGRFRLAEDPDIRAEVPGFRYDAVGDADTRPTHLAMDGVTAAVSDPIWRRFSPPRGYNCRCTLALATEADLRAAGMYDRSGRIRPAVVPAGALPHEPGFGMGRPDLTLHGVS